jgi:hypothetical protein
MELELGFLDVPYNRRASFIAAGRKTAPRRLRKGNMTTARLSDILEEKYQIVDFFVESHFGEILEDIFTGIDILDARPSSGRGSRTNYVQHGLNSIQKRFQKMLDRKEMDGQRTGVPTNASILGVRYGRSRMPGRPSFIDTGLYRDSFRARLVEND